MNSFYSQKELSQIGLKHVGKHVKLSKNAKLYGVNQITIGDYSRVDDFCILSGKIEIGRHVHISASVCLFAGDSGIIFHDYSGVSSHSTIYAESDDFNGLGISNSTVPSKYRKVHCGNVSIGAYCQIGAGSIVLPGVKLEEGSVAGAMSMINKDLSAWTVNVGTPCKKLKYRSKDILELVKAYEENDA